MKKYILIAASSVAMLTACQNPMEDERVIRQKDSLMSLIDDRDNSVNDFINSFNEVEGNLNAIAEKQNIIANNTKKGDLKASQKERINDEIKAINELMEKNAQKLKDLNKRLSRSNNKNAQLEKSIQLLNEQLNQKYAELETLNLRLKELDTQVASLKVTVDTLSSKNFAQVQTINAKTTELHTAYYVVGKSKELKQSNLVENKGGVLGIGKTAKLSSNVDNNKFTRIDYTSTTTIPVGSKDAKLVTVHPSDSYTLDKTGKVVNSIIITNPEKFWSASKYLVVSI